MLLIRIQLRVDKVLQILLVVRTQVRHRARGFAVARADFGRAVKGTVVASAFAEAVEPFCAIGLSARPLADDGPLVGSGELRAESTGGGDVI